MKLFITILIFLLVIFYFVAFLPHKKEVPPLPQPKISKEKMIKGIYTDNVSLPRGYEMMAWFTHFNQPLANNKLKYACDNNILPLITWEAITSKDEFGNQTNYELEDIVAGKYDSLFIKELESVKEVCGSKTVIIRLNHEMEGQGWYPWQRDPKLYIDSWQRVVALGEEINPNIKWLWSPNRGTEKAKEYYPGSYYVDYVGLTLNSSDSSYEENKEVLESFGKPVIIGETLYPQIKTEDTEVVAIVEFIR